MEERRSKVTLREFMEWAFVVLIFAIPIFIVIGVSIRP